jgi:hypothetical protein
MGMSAKAGRSPVKAALKSDDTTGNYRSEEMLEDVQILLFHGGSQAATERIIPGGHAQLAPGSDSERILSLLSALDEPRQLPRSQSLRLSPGEIVAAPIISALVRLDQES